MKKKYLIVAIILLQLLFLSSMVWFHSVKLRNAVRIQLETVPYDPVSVFRGNYAALRYQISSLPVELLKDTDLKDLKNGDELFVLLKKGKDLWGAEAIYGKRPKNEDGVYLRGRLRYYYNSYYRNNQPKHLDLEYGIESFFLNEGRAKEVDRLNTGMDWQEREKEKKRRIGGLDEETRRIQGAGIATDWWMNKLNNELDFWVKEGLISSGAKESIHNKYAKAIEKTKAVEEELTSATQKPLIVEVAIDRNGYGYPVRLFAEGKEYK